VEADLLLATRSIFEAINKLETRPGFIYRADLYVDESCIKTNVTLHVKRCPAGA